MGHYASEMEGDDLQTLYEKALRRSERLAKRLDEVAAELEKARAQRDLLQIALEDGCDLGLAPDECREALARIVGHSADA